MTLVTVYLNKVYPCAAPCRPKQTIRIIYRLTEHGVGSLHRLCPRGKKNYKCVLFPPPAQDCVDDKDLICEQGEFCVATVAIHLLLCLSPNKALWVQRAEARLQE